MAEAAAVSQHRFFCHSCKGQVSPKLPEYTCPRCESGFIEEVTDDASFLDGGGAEDGASAHFAELWDHLDHTMFFPDFRPFLSGGSLDPEREPERVPPAQPELWGPGRPPRLPVTRRYRPRGSSRPDRSPAIEGIIQQIFAGFFANSAVPGSQHPFSWSGMLHSNPGDYAWGQSGLDAIVTQLLGQLENTGPPPADKERISSLPTVPVTQEQVGRRRLRVPPVATSVPPSHTHTRTPTHPHTHTHTHTHGVLASLASASKPRGMLAAPPLNSLYFGIWFPAPTAPAAHTGHTAPAAHVAHAAQVAPAAHTRHTRHTQHTQHPRHPRHPRQPRAEPAGPCSWCRVLGVRRSPVAAQRRVWSARCARRITRRPSRCGSCPATTSSTAAASCPGWSCTTRVPSAGKASRGRIRRDRRPAAPARAATAARTSDGLSDRGARGNNTTPK